MKTQWSIQTRYFVLSALIIFGVAFLYLFRDLISPIVIAALIAYVLYPLARELEDRTPAFFNQRMAVILVFILFLVVLSLIPATITPIIIEGLTTMDTELELILAGIGKTLTDFQVMGLHIFEDVPYRLTATLAGIFDPQTLYESAQAITHNLVWMIVIAIMIYYFMMDWEMLRSWGYRLVPKDYQKDAMRLYRRLNNVWKVFLRGQLVAIIIIGIISGIAATILGMPGPVIIGLIAAALAIIPSIGSSFMIFVAGAVALFSQSVIFPLSGFLFVFVVVIVFTAIHLFDNYWMRPRLLGQGLQLHPGLVLLGVIGAISMGGALLALVIVPVISTIQILLVYLIRRIMGADPWAGLNELTPSISNGPGKTDTP